MPHKFDPREAGRLFAEERRSWQPPEVAVIALGLRPGEAVADLGCGPGYFTRALARAVGPQGKVYAVDLSPEMLERLRETLGEGDREPGEAAVEMILSGERRVPLSSGSVDAVLLANVLHEAEDPEGLLREARRISRPGGRCLVVEWRKDRPSPPGPPVEDRLEEDRVLEWAEKVGWRVTARPEAGPYHFALLLEAGTEEGGR
jgi:ubiquinone/menaquinone biosynthesis C-methylase UbiE